MKLNKGEKRAKSHIEPRNVKGRTYYYYRRGVDKPIYLGTADDVLMGFKGDVSTKVWNDERERQVEVIRLSDENWRLRNKLASTENELSIWKEKAKRYQQEMVSRGVVFGD